VVHQYGYGREDDSTHHYRTHGNSAPPLFHLNAGKVPGMGKRQASSSSVYPPLVEEPEEMGEVQSAPAGPGYLDPYGHPGKGRLSRNPSKVSDHAPQASPTAAGRLANMFHFGSADSSRYEVRGGTHRGTKDYPHLRTKDIAVEREERAALVDRETDGDDDGEDGTLRSTHRRSNSEAQDGEDAREYDEPRSAVTDESFGHVLQAERIPAPSPVITMRPPVELEDDQKTLRGGSPRGPRAYGSGRA
jgi:hypothetical protein